MPIVEIYGSQGLPVAQNASGELVLSGVLTSITGGASILDPVWVSGAATVTVDNFPTGFYFREGSAAAVAASASWVVKASAGKVGVVSVIVSGTEAGGVYNTSAAASASGANLVAVVPATIGLYDLKGFPCSAGIVYIAGAGQTASISYE